MYSNFQEIVLRKFISLGLVMSFNVWNVILDLYEIDGPGILLVIAIHRCVRVYIDKVTSRKQDHSGRDFLVPFCHS